MKKIDEKSWIAMHPYAGITYVDSVYMLIANDIYSTVENYLKNVTHVRDQEIEWISCCLSAYLEDRISGINIFRSFNKLHLNLYDKIMPFYRLDSRYDQEGINSCDINFIIWNCLQQIQIINKDTRLINPYNNKIVNLTSKIYSYFRKIVNNKEADINYDLRSYYYMLHIDSSDQLIERILNLKTRSYLLATYEDYLRFKEGSSKNILSGSKEDIDLPVMLGLNAHQWYAQMLGYYRNEYMELVEKLEIVPIDSYRFKSQVNGKQQFESVSTHRQIAINLAEYIDLNKLPEDVYYLHSSLIRFNNKWELVAPVQITRKPDSSLRTIPVPDEDPGICVIKNLNKQLTAFSKGFNIKFFESLGDLISFMDNPMIAEELKRKFGNDAACDYVLYPKTEGAVSVIKSVSCFIFHPDNKLYDSEYTTLHLQDYMKNASTQMKKIIINMFLRHLIVDLNGFEGEEDESIFKDNIPFIASYFLQYM